MNDNILIELAHRFDLHDFVETGTNNGDQFRAMRGHFDRMFTIEIDGPPSKLVSEFNDVNGAYLFKGSSGILLPKILQDHNIKRALFWLDAHGNQTWYKDDGNNQVPKELEAIRQWAPESLVIIDDITYHNGGLWVNDSYKFDPGDWVAEPRLESRIVILHRGGYDL